MRVAEWGSVSTSVCGALSGSTSAYLRGSQALETSAKGTERSPLRRGNVDGHASSRVRNVGSEDAKLDRPSIRQSRRLSAQLLCSLALVHFFEMHSCMSLFRRQSLSHESESSGEWKKSNACYTVCACFCFRGTTRPTNLYMPPPLRRHTDAHFVRVKTSRAIFSSASLASVSGSLRSASIAALECCSASAKVRSAPEERKIRCLACTQKRGRGQEGALGVAMERSRAKWGKKRSQRRTHPVHIAVPFELALNQLAQLGELVPRVQRRRGREAELQVCAAARLAEFGRRGGKIEHVVDELEVLVQSSVVALVQKRIPAAVPWRAVTQANWGRRSDSPGTRCRDSGRTRTRYP